VQIIVRKRISREKERPQGPATRASGATQALRLGFLLTLAILVIEVIGGTLAHSLALLSDAGHALTDVFALGLAWFAAAQAERPPNARSTYGYHRVGILAALANGVTLIAVASVIGYEAYQRLMRPQAVQPGIMVLAALIAIGVNLFLALRLRDTHAAHAGHDHDHTHGEAHHHGNLNTRAALLHVIGDVGASLAVVLGAGIIALTGATWVDPALSVLIAIVIAFGALKVIRETINILLEATPKGFQTARLANDMRHVVGVLDVHDLHVWTIASGMLALSCHAVIDDVPVSQSARILDRLVAMLRRDYHITHTTIQFESHAHSGHSGFCVCQEDPCADGSLFCKMNMNADGEEHETQETHQQAPKRKSASNKPAALRKPLARV